MKIRKRIILTFLTLFTLIMVLVGTVTIIISSRNYNQKAKDSLLTLTDARADHLRTLLSSEKEETKMMAASQVLRDFLKTTPGTSEYTQQKERSNERLKRTIEANEEIYEYLLLDKAGKVILATGETPIGSDKSQDPYFTQAQENVYLKNLYHSETLQKNLLSISSPIKDDQTNNLLGVIVTRYTLDEINEIIQDRTGLGRTGENFIVNSEKYFITPSLYLGNEVVLKQKVETQNVNDCFNPQEITSAKKDPEIVHVDEAVKKYRDYRGVTIWGTHVYVPEIESCLIGKIDYVEVNKPVVNQLLIFVGIFSLSILAFILISFLVSKRISRPIEELSEDTEIIKKGNLDYKVGRNTKDEVGELSRNFDQMVASIKASRAEVDQKVLAQTKDIQEKQTDMENQQKAILNILEDVEEEKNNVSREKDKINAILYSIGDGVFVTDKNLNIVMYNQIASQISGFSPEEAMGKKYSDILKFIYEKDGKINDAFIKKAIETGQITEMANHTLLIKKDGSKISVADSAAPLKDGRGEISGCVVVFRDITREREIDQAKTDFVSVASHQLRTPLTAIKWYIEMLLSDKTKLTEQQQKDYMQEVSKGSQRLVTLVNDLLNITRIETGRLKIETKPIDLIAYINDIIKETKPLADSRQCQLVFEKPKSVLPAIPLDTTLIRQVYLNLITNAIHYSPPENKIVISLNKDHENIIFSVKDSGIGIPKEEQPKIFGRFFRASNASKTIASGTGLGLYISKLIIESSNGKIWFESVENKGTTFFASIPIVGMKNKKGERSLAK